MSAKQILIAALLGAAGLIQFLCVLGVLVMPHVYDRLHFTGPASIFGPFCLALAVVIDEGPTSQAGLKFALPKRFATGCSFVPQPFELGLKPLCGTRVSAHSRATPSITAPASCSRRPRG